MEVKYKDINVGNIDERECNTSFRNKGDFGRVNWKRRLSDRAVGWLALFATTTVHLDSGELLSCPSLNKSN